MDNAVTVILSRIIVKRGLQCAGRLIERLVADRMHLDLQSGTVRRLTELDHLLI